MALKEDTITYLLQTVLESYHEQWQGNDQRRN